MTDEAEKEASEVLHSLLSVERIEKRKNFVVDTSSPGANIRWNSDAHPENAVVSNESDEVYRNNIGFDMNATLNWIHNYTDFQFESI